jgi:hypothetical protein
MRRKFILFTLLIAVCSLAVWAGVSPQKGKGKAKADAGKVNEARDQRRDPSQCSSPRPKNRGCSIRCKPCFTPVCENGKWVYEKVEWSKEECSPRPLPGEGGGGCTRNANGQCPAECKKCV